VKAGLGLFLCLFESIINFQQEAIMNIGHQPLDVEAYETICEEMLKLRELSNEIDLSETEENPEP